MNNLQEEIANALNKAVTRGQGIRITAGFGWAGFWIGIGLVFAAAIIKGQVIIK